MAALLSSESVSPRADWLAVQVLSPPAARLGHEADLEGRSVGETLHAVLAEDVESLVEDHDAGGAAIISVTE